MWYRGDAFRGFQAQVQGPTVQQTLEAALAELGTPARVLPAGRTDLGVHARMQVLSLRLPESLEVEALPQRLRPLLPPTVGLVAAHPAPKGFHAQWTAEEKEYRYRVCPGPVPPGWERCAWALGGDARLGQARLDLARLEAVLAGMCGTRDFIAFHENSSPRRLRTLRRATCHLLEGGRVVELRLVGDAFARYMARYLVGSAVAVAAGVMDEAPVRAALETGAEYAGLKAPAEGLVLWEVRYPSRCDAFPAAERATAPGLPQGPPFRTGEE